MQDIWNNVLAIWNTVLACLVWLEEIFDAHERTITGLFTVLLALSTVALWRSTRRLWKVTDRTAKHIPRAERAYIYGGVGIKFLVARDDFDVDLGVEITLANYGRTPGFVKHIRWGVGDLATISGVPQYNPIPCNVSDLYFPEMKMHEVRPSGLRITFSRYGNPVVFQRTFYDDIFGKEHYSGSIYRVFLEERNGRYFICNEPVRPGSAYWEWDKEE
jgi:hypothetical protein